MCLSSAWFDDLTLYEVTEGKNKFESKAKTQAKINHMLFKIIMVKLFKTFSGAVFGQIGDHRGACH